MPQSRKRTVTDNGGSTPPPPCEHPAHRAGWYALRLRGNREFRVGGYLEELGAESFLPSVKEKSQWSDRTKEIERPLFPGYIFVRSSIALVEVLRLPGVVQALPTSTEPALIDEREIESLRIALASGNPAAECPYVAGEPVTIETGPLAGVTGFVTRTRGICRVAVAIRILNRAVSVEIDTADLQHTELPRGRGTNRAEKASPKGCDTASHAPARPQPFSRRSADTAVLHKGGA